MLTSDQLTALLSYDASAATVQANTRPGPRFWRRVCAQMEPTDAEREALEAAANANRVAAYLERRRQSDHHRSRGPSCPERFKSAVMKARLRLTHGVRVNDRGRENRLKSMGTETISLVLRDPATGRTLRERMPWESVELHPAQTSIIPTACAQMHGDMEQRKRRDAARRRALAAMQPSHAELT